MKDDIKSVFLAVLLLIGAASLPARITYAVDSSPSVISLSPDSGPPGARVTVRGAGFSISSPNTIGFNAESGGDGTTFSSGSSDGARLSFSVPNLSLGPYRITVSNNENGAGAVYQTFTIIAPSATTEPSLIITAPSIGETFTIGSQYTIRWSADDMPTSHLPDYPNFSVNLLNENGSASMGRIARNLGASTGSYLWTVGRIYEDSDLGLANPQTIPPGSYRVQVKSGVGVNNVSNGAFTIAAPVIRQLACGIAGVPGSFGDMNLDGIISPADADFIIGFLLGKTALTDIQQKNADTDGDHQITNVDITYIRQYLNRQVDTFPACMIAAPSVPTVTSVSPSSGPPGTTVTVTGSGFSTSSPNTIQFNAESGGGGTTFTAISSDGTTLQFTAPDLSVGPYLVTVSTSGSSGSATGQLFTLTTPGGGDEGGGGNGGGGEGSGGGGGVGGGPLPGTIGIFTPSGQAGTGTQQTPTTTPHTEISLAAPFATSSPATSTTTASALPKTSIPCIKIEKFIRLGAANDPVEVRKVQEFVRRFGDVADVQVNGIYDIPTFNAVKAFQQKYTGDVLTPWTASQPTGHVFITTRKKMNEILCAPRDPFTPEETATIAAYRRNLIAGVMGALSNTIVPEVSSQKGTEEIKPLTEGEKTAIELYSLRYENAATGAGLAQDESSSDETAESIAANKTGVIQTSLSAAVGFLRTVANGITVAGERTARGGELLFKKTGDFFRAVRPSPSIPQK